MPPAFIRLGFRVHAGDNTFHFWFPLFLFWPLLLAIFLLAQAVFLLAAFFTLFGYPRRAWLLLSLPVRVLHLVSLTRGTVVDIGDKFSLKLV